MAPIAERSSNLWTAYNEATRDYTVAVQDYPAPGMDTFFVVNINNDVTSAKPLLSNVIIGHPDGSTANQGKLTLTKVLYDSNGNHLAVFNDGSVYGLDVANKSYKLFANLYSASSITASYVSNAHSISNGVLKSVVYDTSSYISYLIKTDLATGTVSKAVEIQQVKGQLGSETPINGHHMVDANTGETKFMVIFTGNFDTMSFIDETTGVQTQLYSDLTHQVEGLPVEFLCTESTKDCDTKWATSAYDPKTNTLYFQTHQMGSNDDEIGTTYIYSTQFLKNHVTNIYYPISDPAVTMTFGYYGYQFVGFNN